MDTIEQTLATHTGVAKSQVRKLTPVSYFIDEWVKTTTLKNSDFEASFKQNLVGTIATIEKRQ
jgi:hypothetical protein